MSKPLFFRLLLAFAIAFAGSVAQLHSLAHAQHDLAAASEDHKAPVPLKHATDQCLVVHALDGTAAEGAFPPVAEKISHRVVPPVAVRSGEAPAAAFRSRAPPLSA
jgi:hypothetical protein